MSGLARNNVYLRPKGTNTLTVHVKPIKAGCPANQPALDRIQEAYVKAQANPNSNYVHTLRRAMRSLQECREAITTQKDAQKLKHIGMAIARMICPNDPGVTTTTTTSSRTSPSPALATMAAVSSKHSTKIGGKDLTITTISTSALSRLPSSPSGTAQAQQQQQQQPPQQGPTAKERAYALAKDEAETLILPPGGPWKVILLVDCRERRSKQVVSACKQSGIPCEERQLPIGDMAWIARCCSPKEGHGLQGKKQESSSSSSSKALEIMVGTIVERKEVNDLTSSLYGTRYNEQRLRLSQCGLPQVLFLVEGEISQVINCPPEALHMAMMETRVQLGFKIIQTKHLTETVRVLKGLHRRIVQRTFPEAFARESPQDGRPAGGMSVPTYHHDPMEARPSRQGSGRRRNRRVSSLLEMVFDTAPVPPFGTERFVTYPELKTKVEVDRERGTRSVRALTMAMLKQIPSLSQKKCLAIGQAYPTMNRLLEAICYHCDGNPDKLLQSLPMDDGRRTIGPMSASEVCAACCTLADGTRVVSTSMAVATTNSLPPPCPMAQPVAVADQRSSNTASMTNKATTKKPPASARPVTKRTMSSTTAQATNPRKVGVGVVASGVNRYLSAALQNTNSNDNTIEAAARRIMMANSTTTTSDSLNPNDDSSVEAIDLVDADNGLASPPAHHLTQSGSNPVLFDLLTPEVKSTGARKAASEASIAPAGGIPTKRSQTRTNNRSKFQSSLMFPSPDSSPGWGWSAPSSLATRPAKRPRVRTFRDDIMNDQNEKENQFQRDLKHAMRASIGDGSSPESVLLSTTPRKEKSSRTVSDDPVVKPPPGAIVKASRQNNLSPGSSSSSSSNSDEDDDLYESSTLRARLAKKLNREVISIDSD